MTFTIERAAARLKATPVIYWISNGPAEMFCLGTGDTFAVAFSDRYIIVAAQFRQLLMMAFDDEIRTDMAERLCLRVIAEFALQKGDPDLAALCFIKSKTGERVVIADTRSTLALEYEPISERYMFAWFFGLLHEIGHQHAADPERRTFMEGVFPDEAVRDFIKEELESEDLPEVLRPDAEQLLATNSLFSPARLREEAFADLFACEIMLETTRDLLDQVDARQVDTSEFLIELLLTINAMGLVERCRLIAALAPGRRPIQRDDILKLALQFITLKFRAHVALWYASRALCEFSPGSTPETFADIVAAHSKRFRPAVDAIQDGYRAAMRYTTSAKSRLDDLALLEGFRLDLNDRDGGIAIAETEAFLALAESMEAKSDLFVQLSRITADIATPIEHVGTGARFAVAWIEGADGLSVPFTIQTKYGPICFAFRDGNPVFQQFFDLSAADLIEGYTLKRALFVVPRPEGLGGMILAHASDDAGFGLVWEGSEGFDELFAELVSGDIFYEQASANQP